MIQFIKPEKLNGIQLIEELKAANIDVIGNPLVDADGSFWLNVKTEDKSKVEAIVKNHIGIDTMPTIEDKLASVGLSVSDLKEALGL